MNKGFTLIEVVVSTAIIAVLVMVGVIGFVSSQKRSSLNNALQEAANVLRYAQSKTLSFKESGRYGVYFDSATSPDSYTLFKGDSYPSRDVLADEIYFLPDTVEFSSIDFQGASDLVFNRLTGSVDNWGSVSLRLKDDVSQEKSVYVSNLGIIGFSQMPSADDSGRIKDSRHVHVNYTRIIATDTEYVVLTSIGSPVLQIPISPNLVGGQFEWEGVFSAGGQDQTVKIHTHWLNDAVNYTQFSIHRDRRFNSAPFEIGLSGDGSGTIIEYTTDGAITTSQSANVPTPPGPEWQ